MLGEDEGGLYKQPRRRLGRVWVVQTQIDSDLELRQWSSISDDAMLSFTYMRHPPPRE